MNNLMVQNSQTINSREVAEMMNIAHSNLMQKLDGSGKNVGIVSYLRKSTEVETMVSKYFIESNYKDSTGRKLKCYEVTLDGVDLIIQHSRKTPKIKNLIDYLNEVNYYSKEVICINRFELSFSQALIETLKPMNIEVETQKPMFNGKYKIDFYIPQYNLAVEYDEEPHQYQIQEDLQRQLEIEKELNCKTIRLDYKNNDNFNVGIILNEIINNMVA